METVEGSREKRSKNPLRCVNMTRLTANSAGSGLIFVRISGFGNNPVKYTAPDGKAFEDLLSGFEKTFSAIGTLIPLINRTAGVEDLKDINNLLTSTVSSLNNLIGPLGTVTLVAMIAVTAVIVYYLKDPILEFYEWAKQKYEKFTRIKMRINDNWSIDVSQEGSKTKISVSEQTPEKPIFNKPETSPTPADKPKIEPLPPASGEKTKPDRYSNNASNEK